MTNANDINFDIIREMIKYLDYYSFAISLIEIILYLDENKPEGTAVYDAKREKIIEIAIDYILKYYLLFVYQQQGGLLSSKTRDLNSLTLPEQARQKSVKTSTQKKLDIIMDEINNTKFPFDTKDTRKHVMEVTASQSNELQLNIVDLNTHDLAMGSVTDISYILDPVTLKSFLK
jgi:hypothetical protein